MSVINYAVEIITEQTSFTNSAYGLVSGTFRFITGRPGYDGGDNPYPTWEDTTDNTAIWYEGWLLKDRMSNPSRKVDISQTGDYGALSGFSFSIRNDLLLWKYVRDNAIYFTNRTVKLYVIIDDVFYQTWTGVISNNPYDEIDYRFDCIDSFKKIHKTIPPLVIDKTVFPDSTSDSQGDSIPVCVGDISYAKVKTIKKEASNIVLSYNDYFGNDLYPVKAVAAIKYETTGLTYPKLHLYMTNKTFSTDELKGAYIYTAAGGGDPDTDQIIKIHSSVATSSNITVIELEAPFDDTTESSFNTIFSYNPNKLYYTMIYKGDYSAISSPNWISYDHVDFSNSGVGSNQIRMLIKTTLSGTIYIHKGIVTDDVIGYILITPSATLPGGSLSNSWYTGTVDCQYGSDETITFEFKDGINMDNAVMDRFHVFHNVSNDQTWWFSICDFASSHVVSTGDIKGYVTDKNNLPIIYKWSEDSKSFDLVSNLLLSAVTDTSGATGHPELAMYNSKIQKDGSIRYIFPMPPDRWNVKIEDGESSIQLTNILGENQVNSLNDKQCQTLLNTNPLADRNMKTDISIYMRSFASMYREYKIIIDLSFPVKYLNDKFEKIFLGLDFLVEATPEDTRISIDFDMLDSYGNVVFNADDVADDPVSAYSDRVYYPIDKNSRISGTYPVYLLPEEYYKAGGTTGTPYPSVDYESLWSHVGIDSSSGKDDTITMKGLVELPDEIFKAIKNGSSTNVVRLTLHVTSNRGETLGLPFYGNLFLQQAGFVGMKSVSVLSNDFYVRLKGETFDDEETNNVYNAFRLMLEGYDGISSDDINYNNLELTRRSWPVGRQIIDRKSSFDYLKELCTHSFVCIYPDRTGRRALRSWLEDTTSKDTVSEATIVRDSISKWENTSMTDLFNDFRIWYNNNLATGTYDNCITITNVDQSVFPDATTMATFPDTLELWKTYVGGLSSNSYEEAKALWNVCHNGYLQASAIQTAGDNISKLPWFNSIGLFNGLGGDVASTTDSAYKYLQWLVLWTTHQKAFTEYSKPITSSNVALDILDYITFSDAIFTDSDSRTGWITSIELDITNDTIKYQAVLEPEDIVEDNLIIELGYIDDAHDETGNQPDQVWDGEDRL